MRVSAIRACHQGSGATNGGTNSICIRSSSANLGTNAAGTKPLSELTWSADGGTTWYAITTTFVEIPGSEWSGCCRTVNLIFRMALDWAADDPDTYFSDLPFRTGRV